MADPKAESGAAAAPLERNPLRPQAPPRTPAQAAAAPAATAGSSAPPGQRLEPNPLRLSESPQTQSGESQQTQSGESPQTQSSDSLQTLSSDSLQTLSSDSLQTLSSDSLQTLSSEGPQALPAPEQATDANATQCELGWLESSDGETSWLELPSADDSPAKQALLIGGVLLGGYVLDSFLRSFLPFGLIETLIALFIVLYVARAPHRRELRERDATSAKALGFETLQAYQTAKQLRARRLGKKASRKLEAAMTERRDRFMPAADLSCPGPYEYFFVDTARMEGLDARLESAPGRWVNVQVPPAALRRANPLKRAVGAVKRGLAGALWTVLRSGALTPLGLLTLFWFFAQRSDWLESTVGVLVCVATSALLLSLGAVLGLSRGIAQAAIGLVDGFRLLLVEASSMLVGRGLQQLGAHNATIPISKLDAVFANWQEAIRGQVDSKGWKARGFGWLLGKMIVRVREKLKKELSSRTGGGGELNVSELEERIRGGAAEVASKQVTRQLFWIRRAANAGIAILALITLISGVTLG